MNLSLTGFPWRLALRAVPESNRPEILGTLTDLYGNEAPLGEAVRTFKSGNRMSNRANASTPLDLWREATRNATSFSLIAMGLASVGLALFSRTWEYRPPLASTVAFAAFCVLGVFLQRGQFLRFTGLAVMAWSAIYLFVMDKNMVSWKNSKLGWAAASTTFILLSATSVVLLFTRLSAKQRIAIAGGSFVVFSTGFRLLEGMLLARSSSPHYSFFAILHSGIFTSAVIGWVSTPEAKTAKKVWWPAILGCAVGVAAVLANSRFENPAMSLAGKLFGAVAIAAAVVGLALLAIRPQLLLALGVLFIQQSLLTVSFINWHASQWSLRTAMNILLPAAALAIAIAGSRRSLRQY